MAAIFKCQIAKNQNAYSKIHCDPKLVQFNEIFFGSNLLFLVTEAILTDLFLINFETTQYKDHFNTNLVKIHPAVIEILSISCHVLFLVMADGGHLGMLNKKN